MSFLNNILIIILALLLILNYFSLHSKKSAIKIVNDMGIGYNLGKTFNIFDISENNAENYQIKMWGTILPTKKMINKIKKYGFKTIRFEVISTNSIDDSGKINSEWISRIKEVINWIINSNMYCILSIYFEGKYWQRKNIINKYMNFWKQIGKELINFDEHLILESMNEYNYKFLYDYSVDHKEDIYYDYEHYHMNLLNCTQAFIYIIRNSGGFNAERLLVIPGILTEIELNTYKHYFDPEMPIDPSNKLAVSLNYYFPSQLYQNFYLNLMEWYNKNGMYYPTEIITNWGSNKDYKEIMKYFDFLKEFFINNGIPVIIGQVGILTDKENNINSFKEFLYVIFSISIETNGIMSCLWDISEKIERDICYYNKEKNVWIDEQIKEIFIKISKRKNVHISEYYYNTKFETESNDNYNYLEIGIGTRKVTTIIINAKTRGKLHIDYEFFARSSNKNGEWINILIEDKGKRQYDGTTIYTIDVSDKELNNRIEVLIYWGVENFLLNNITAEFEEEFFYFDYKSYKSNVLEDINKIY